MLDLTSSGILELLTHYGYIVIFPISILEGPIVSVLAGFLVSVGKLNMILVFLLLLAGDLIGDTLYYSLGRFFRRKKIPRWLVFLGIRAENVHFFAHFFKQHDWKILMVGKAQAVGSVILFSAGLARMPYGPFLFYNFLASVPKIMLFEGIGFYFGEAYHRVEVYFDIFGVISLLLALLLLGGYFVFKRYLKMQYEELQEK